MIRILLISLFISTSILQAAVPDSCFTELRRRSCFREGESYLSFGTGIYGLNNAASRSHAMLTNFKNAGLPPIFFRYEYAVSDYIGLGGTFFLNIASYKWDKSIEIYNYDTWTYEPIVYEEKFSGLSLGFLARANFHFATSRNNDPYFGLGLGYEFFMMKMTSEDPLVTERTANRPLPFSLEAVIGWRTYIADYTAIYFEAGYGKMLFNIGLTMRLD